MNSKKNQETIDLLLSRRSVKAINLIAPGPSDEEIEILLKCGSRVPDHGKLAPWRIQVILGKAQEEIGQLFSEVFKSQNPEASVEEIEFERLRPCRAPLLLVISTFVRNERIPRWEQILSGAAVCQNLLIAATALGYYAQWLSEWPNYSDAIKSGLGIANQDNILGFIYIGSTLSPLLNVLDQILKK